MEDIQFKCVHCNKKFAKRKILYVHIRNIHKKEPKFPTNRSKNTIICSCCSKIVKSYSDLRDHLVTEHDIKIFSEELTFENKNGK